MENTTNLAGVSLIYATPSVNRRLVIANLRFSSGESLRNRCCRGESIYKLEYKTSLDTTSRFAHASKCNWDTLMAENSAIIESALRLASDVCCASSDISKLVNKSLSIKLMITMSGRYC